MYNSQRHFKRMYASVTGAFEFRAQTRTDFFSWQRRFRPRLRQTLGLDAMAIDLAGHKPHATQRKVEDSGDHTRELWHLWVEPTVPLPFYLLRPKGLTGRLPLVLTPHGHNPSDLYVGIAKNARERRMIRDDDGDVAVQAVREGYLTIAPTTRGFGETRTEHDRRQGSQNSCRLLELHGLLAGRTAIGQRVWDIERLIDWAFVNLEMDSDRIAITGDSTGGMISLFAAACDTRIAVSVPSCYFCTFRGSIGSIHHCECNYVAGILRLGEMADVAGLIAPRPFCAITGKTDALFPIRHVRHAYRQLKHIYTIAGVAERCRLHVETGGHRYYKAGAWPFIREAFSQVPVARVSRR
jgi:Abhydrolase family